jgi:hypothetical protein
MLLTISPTPWPGRGYPSVAAISSQRLAFAANPVFDQIGYRAVESGRTAPVVSAALPTSRSVQHLSKGGVALDPCGQTLGCDVLTFSNLPDDKIERAVPGAGGIDGAPDQDQQAYCRAARA